MLSRHADACYWIGRYVERAEATARMVDVHYHASLESGRTVLNWNSLLTIADGLEDFTKRYSAQTDANVLRFFLFDRLNPDSVVSTWGAVRENARSIREQLSSEMWVAINVFYLNLQKIDVAATCESPGEFLWKVQEASHLVQGILNRTMLMDEPREWLDVGRFLERADQTNRLLDVKYHDILPSIPQRQGQPPETLPDPMGVGGPLDTHGWIAVLKSVSAFEMYRKTYRDGIVPANVVAFLELQNEFPASVRHGVERVNKGLKRIRGASNSHALRAPEQLALKLLADLEYDQADQIIATGLHEYLQDKQVRLAELGAAIWKAYLA